MSARNSLWVAVGIILIAASATAWSNAPHLVSYQGLLKTSTGSVVPDGNYDLNVRIYDKNGAELWHGIFNGTQTRGGVFNIMLGLNESIFADTTRWVGVTVGSDPEISPRTRLTSFAFSFKTATVDSATGGAIKGDVTLLGQNSGGDNGLRLSGRNPSIWFTNTGTGGRDSELHQYDDRLQLTLIDPLYQNTFRVSSTNGTTPSLSFEVCPGCRGVTFYDPNFYLKFADWNNPLINFNTDDYLEFDRPSNRFLFKTNADSGQIVLRDQAFRDKVKITATGRNGSSGGAVLELRDNTGATRIELDGTEDDNAPDITLYAANGTTKVIQIDAAYGGAGNPGRIVTPVLEITGGADLSEQFDVNSSPSGVAPVAGSVVCIDPDHPGDLVVSEGTYCRAVAGIVSGAGGIVPGLLMGQKGTAHGQFPIALSGRTYVLADASNGSIEVGDLLTTAILPGHVMRADDDGPTHGAIVGKAMTRLEAGQGLVLVLVNLQ